MGDGGEGDRRGHYTGVERGGSVAGDHGGLRTDNKKKDEDCFVASAVYGDTNAHEVNVLRGYRDNVLMKSYLGRKIVEAYYGIGSRRIADFIVKRARFVIPVIRKGLDHIVSGYETKNLANLEDKKQ